MSEAEGSEAESPEAEGERNGVILLKGLSRASFEMLPMGWCLTRAGFEYHAPRYPSRELTVDQAAEAMARSVDGFGWDVVHVVGHSLGGIVASKMIADHAPPEGARWGRAVQLGAPNAGTAVATMLSKIPPLRRFLGPTIEEMAGPREDIVAASDSPHVGAIACDTGQSPMGAASGMPVPNDGKVSVASAIGKAEHRLVMATGHAFYPYSRRVCEATTLFLQEGSFASVPDGWRA